MGKLQQSVMNEMDSVDWSNIDTSQYQDTGYTAMVTGIYNYLIDMNNATLVTTVTGVLTLPPPLAPIPAYTGSAESGLTFGTKDALKALVIEALNTATTDNVVALTAFFTALSTWLLTTVVTITGWIPSSLGTLKGVGTALFPTMVIQGSLCSAQLLAETPTSKEESWLIMEKYIILGLVGTSTIPGVVGTITATTGVFAGAGVGTITYNKGV